MDAQTNNNAIKVRVVALIELVDQHAGRIIRNYEQDGYECVEWSKPYPCKPPDSDKAIVYLSFIKAN